MRFFKRRKKEPEHEKIEINNPIISNAVIELAQMEGKDIDGDIIHVFNNIYFVHVLNNRVVLLNKIKNCR